MPEHPSLRIKCAHCDETAELIWDDFGYWSATERYKEIDEDNEIVERASVSFDMSFGLPDRWDVARADSSRDPLTGRRIGGEVSIICPRHSRDT